jgi:hypothetical protein
MLLALFLLGADFYTIGCRFESTGIVNDFNCLQESLALYPCPIWH